MLLNSITGSAFLLQLTCVNTYSQAAVSSLNQLTADTLTTIRGIASYSGCGFSFQDTTAAIREKAAISSGSACLDADDGIVGFLSPINAGLTGTVDAFAGSVLSNEVSSETVIDDFNSFTNAYYTLFNALGKYDRHTVFEPCLTILDLAECTYVLTPNSQTHHIAFADIASIDTPGTLEGGYNALVGSLNRTLAIQLGIQPANLRMQSHFGGTSLLSSTVTDEDTASLLACNTITTIVANEGGVLRRRALYVSQSLDELMGQVNEMSGAFFVIPDEMPPLVQDLEKTSIVSDTAEDLIEPTTATSQVIDTQDPGTPTVFVRPPEPVTPAPCPDEQAPGGPQALCTVTCGTCEITPTSYVSAAPFGPAENGLGFGPRVRAVATTTYESSEQSHRRRSPLHQHHGMSRLE